MKTCFTMPFVLALFLITVPAGAELRQWTDEHGVKHFSNKDELPEGVSIERSYEEKESSVDAPIRRRNPAPAVRPQSKPKPHQPKQPRSKTPFKRKEILAQIRALEDKQNAVFERIYTKRRYVKRQGKKDIDRIRRLNGDIKSLEASGSENPGTLEKLKDERDAAKERLFNENIRTRKGLGEDIREYKQLEAEIANLRKQL